MRIYTVQRNKQRAAQQALLTSLVTSIAKTSPKDKVRPRYSLEHGGLCNTISVVFLHHTMNPPNSYLASMLRCFADVGLFTVKLGVDQRFKVCGCSLQRRSQQMQLQDLQGAPLPQLQPSRVQRRGPMQHPPYHREVQGALRHLLR